jgi:predicted alpha-1,2-mannosidase
VDESVSKTLEFSYANGAAAALAKYLGKTAEAKAFWERSQSYKKVFDPTYGLMCPKTSDGKFVAPYNPARLDYSPRFVTEGNSWQYNWLVLHDVKGLIDLYGSQEKAAAQLERTFDPANVPIGAQPDVTGLIGQYAHGNEPSHHTAYLFVPFGRHDLAEKYVRLVRDGMYSDKVDGLIGNDDCGQMSAWYVFSVMGFYPLDPTSGTYTLCIPAFPKLTVTLETGKKVVITTKNLDLQKGTVKSITWNGEPLPNREITHKQLIEGGTLEFNGE